MSEEYNGAQSMDFEADDEANSEEALVFDAEEGRLVPPDEVVPDPAAETGPEGEPDPELAGYEDGPGVVRVEFDGDPLELDLTGLSEEQATKVKSFTESAYRVYNRKVQETEQVIGMAAQHAQEIAEMRTLEGDRLQAAAQLQHLQSEAARIDALDLPTLKERQPDLWREVIDLRHSLQDDIAKHEQAFRYQDSVVAERRQGQLAQQFQIGRAQVLHQIPGFEQSLPQLAAYAEANYGIPQQVVMQGWALEPARAVAAFKAMQFDHIAAANGGGKAAPSGAQPVKPVKAGKRAASPPSSRATGSEDMKDYVAKRQAELRALGR